MCLFRTKFRGEEIFDNAHVGGGGKRGRSCMKHKKESGLNYCIAGGFRGRKLARISKSDHLQNAKT